MEPEQPQPDVEKVEQEKRIFAHTLQDDLDHAMQAVDPASVQQMFADARSHEAEIIERKTEHKERRWYSMSSFVLILLTLAVLAVGTYLYMHLTVKVIPAQSVGVFQSTQNIDVSTTSIQQVLTNLTISTTLPVGKPELVNLVTDATTNTLLTNSQLYSFIGAEVPEPLQSAISVARLGVLNTGKDVIPFIVASVPDPEKASKELTIAEPGLLQLFYQALGITISGIQINSALQPFQSQYFYNLPVRTLSGIDNTGKQSMLFLYGYASNNIVVLTSQPQALKAVYDSIINQH